MDYLLDTNHCIYLINGLGKDVARRSEYEKKIVDKVRNIQTGIFIAEASLGELYFGAANSERKEYNRQRITLFKQAVTPIAIDEDIWRLFGDTKAIMRKRGKSIMDIDLIIACTAKIHEQILVTNDADFDVLPEDFRKENWV